MPSKRSSSDERGLLQPEEFDIDELDYLETSNGHARKSSRDWSTTARNRRGRWTRSKCLCWSFVIIIFLLFTGTALNKGGHLNITNKKPSKASSAEQPPAGAPDSTVFPDQQVAERPQIIHTSSDHSNDETSSYDKKIPAATAALAADIASSSISGSIGSLATAEPQKNSQHSGPYTSNWSKPKGFKIIGLIFYGRPDTVGILDCYLRKNLVRNGGWLDEVHFVMNTDKKDDIAWLDLILDENKEYKKVEVGVSRQVDGYNAAWAKCNKKDMYIKIDDDIVFFSKDAIPNLVFSLMHHPEALNVVATLINSPETGWLHRRLGAIHAYLPEKGRTEEDLKSIDGYGPNAWRASALPVWSGKEEDMTFVVSGVNLGKGDGYVTLPPEDPGAPPYHGHRWLPLPGGDKEIWRTPIAKSEYNPAGPDWASWSLGAQAHYYFLQNLENDTLHLYHMGGGLDPEREGIWDMAYERMNINFMAIWGKDVRDNLPFDTYDDELALSIHVTEKLRRPLLVNTHAIAAHFHFRSQLEMYDTDLLSRYRAYANEMICTRDNQIPVS